MDLISFVLILLKRIKPLIRKRSSIVTGRELDHLHVNYEDVKPYPVTFKKGNPKVTEISNPEKFYYVTEMKFAGNSKEKDKLIVFYNSNITITDIPLEAL